MLLRKIIPLVIPLFLLYSSCKNKNSPDYVAKQYLLALKDKNYDKAKQYCTKETGDILEMMKNMHSDLGITEIAKIKCKIKNKMEATCDFCCSTDTMFICLDLKKEDEKWKVWLPKDGGCRAERYPQQYQDSL